MNFRLLIFHDLMLRALWRSVLRRPLMQVLNFPHLALMVWHLWNYDFAEEKDKNVHRP